MSKQVAPYALLAVSAAAAVPIWGTTGPATFGDIWLGTISVSLGLCGLAGVFISIIAHD